jgi:hypothetical protein
VANAVLQAALVETMLDYGAALDWAAPPLVEQHEIVRQVEALLARADRIEKRLAAATRRV